LYVNRKLLNSDDIVSWAKEQNIEKLSDPNKFHVTIAYSKNPINWEDIKLEKNNLTIENDARKLEFFGEGALVLRFFSKELQNRWQELKDLGASWEYPTYKPHITLIYDSEIDINDIEPYKGSLIFGPENIREIDENWADKTKEIKI
jgi:uncharacterized protein